MFSTVYVSQAVRDLAVDELEALLTGSRRKNGETGITGVLLYKDARFLQVLEGAEDTVRALMSDIVADDRHREIRTLVEEQIDERRFSDWTMGYEPLAEGVPLPGYTDFLTRRRGAGDDSNVRVELLLDWFRGH